MDNTYNWNYMNNPYGWGDEPKSITIKAKSEDDAIWKLYEHVLKKFGSYLNEKDDTYGFYILFHADIYYGSFNSYNLDLATREYFIQEFKFQVIENKDYFSLNKTNIIN